MFVFTSHYYFKHLLSLRSIRDKAIIQISLKGKSYNTSRKPQISIGLEYKQKGPSVDTKNCTVKVDVNTE
jgi:hypothetical protein